MAKNLPALLFLSLQLIHQRGGSRILTTAHKDKKASQHTIYSCFFLLAALLAVAFMIAIIIIIATPTTYQAAYAADPGNWTGLYINGTERTVNSRDAKGNEIKVDRHEATCKIYTGNKWGIERAVGLVAGVATNSTGHIFVLYDHVHCIDIYSPDGDEHLKSFGDWCWVNSGYYFYMVKGEDKHLMQGCQPNEYVFPDKHETNGPTKAATGDGEFAWARGIAIDKYDRVIVADTLNSRIQVFDSNGDFLFKFGYHHLFSKSLIKNGARPLLAPVPGDPDYNYREPHDGQFTAPTSVAVDNKLERIIVANGEGGRNTYGYDQPPTYNIQIYDFDGNFVKKFGQYGKIHCKENENDPDPVCHARYDHDHFWDEKFRYEFNQPYVVAVHPHDSRIFVGDRMNLRIQVYTSEGVYLDTIAGMSDSCQHAPFWASIRGMAFDSHGRLYLSEYFSNRIMVIDYPYGTAPETVNENTYPYGTGGDNPTYPELLYEIRGYSDYVQDGTPFPELGNVYVGDYIERPGRITIDTSAYGKDRIIVSNTYQKFHYYGNELVYDDYNLSVIGLEAIPFPLSSNSNSFDPDSTLPCKAYGRSNADYSVADEWETWGVNSTVDFPRELNYDASVYKYSTNNHPPNNVMPINFNVTEPLAIAFNSTGHMFVTTEEGFLSKLLVFDSDLNHTGTFGGDKGREVPQPYPYPSWNNNKYAYYDPPKIVINSTDHVFISGKSTDAVTVYEPDMKYSSMVYYDQVSDTLWGVAVDDANDRMYVADPKFGLIRVYDHQDSDMWRDEADTIGCLIDASTNSAIDGAMCLAQTDLLGGDGIHPDEKEDAGSEYGMFAAQLEAANFFLDMAVHPDDGRLIVADTGNDRIQIFDKDGELVNAILAVGDSLIEYPLNVIVDPHNGNILFTDRDPQTKNSRIVVLDSDAEPLGIISNLSNSTGHAFEQVTQIAVHPITGQIYAVSHEPPTDKTYTKPEHPHAVIMIGPGIHPLSSSSSSSSSSSKRDYGGSNDYDYITAPTFGLSHDTRSSPEGRLIDSGISLNGFALDVGSFHTEFARQILQTGQDNTLSTKVKTSTGGYGGLRIIEFFYGVPSIGALSQAEGSIEVHLNPYDRGEFPEITDLVMRDNKHSLLLQGDTTVTVQRVDCIKGDARQGCYKIDIGFVFANAPVGEVFALQATDSRGWSTTEYFNDGFEVQGAPLVPVTMSIAADLARGAGKGSTEVTQIDRKKDLWLSADDNTTLYTKNDFGFWKKLTPDRPLNRCSQDTEYDTKEWTVMTRMHCLHGAQVESEAKMAQNVFNSSAIQKELPDSFAYEPPLAIDHRSALLHKLGWITTDDVIKRIELSGRYDHIDGQQLKDKVQQLLLEEEEDDNDNNENSNNISQAVQLADVDDHNSVTAQIYKTNSEITSLKEQFEAHTLILAQIHSALADLSDGLTQQKQELEMHSSNENEFFGAMSQQQQQQHALLYFLPLLSAALAAVPCLFYFRRYAKAKTVQVMTGEQRQLKSYDDDNAESQLQQELEEKHQKMQQTQQEKLQQTQQKLEELQESKQKLQQELEEKHQKTQQELEEKHQKTQQELEEKHQKTQQELEEKHQKLQQTQQKLEELQESKQKLQESEHEKLQQTQQKLEELQESKQNLQESEHEKLQQTQQKLEELQESKQNLQESEHEKLQQTQQKLEELQESKQKMQQELEEKHQKMQQTQQEKLQQTQQKLEELQESKQKLQESEHEKLQQTQQKLEELQESKQKLQESEHEKLQQTQQKLEELQESKQKLQQELEEKHQKMQQTQQEKLQQTQQKLEELQESKQRLQESEHEKLQQTQQKLEELQESKQNLQESEHEKLQQTQQKLEELQESKQKLQQELEEKHQKTQQELEEKLQQTQQKLEELQESKQRLQKSEHEKLQQTQQKLEELQESKQKLQQELEEKHQKTQQELEEKHQKLQQTQQKLEELQESKQKLQQELEEKQQEQQNTQADLGNNAEIYKKIDKLLD